MRTLNYTLFLIGTISTFTAGAQGWMPFDTASQRPVFSIEHALHLTDTPNVSFDAGNLIELKLSHSMNDSAHHLLSGKIRGCSLFDPYSDCFQEMESCMDHFSWIGNPVITDAWVDFYAVNRWEDTLALPAIHRDSTELWRHGDSAYVAVLDHKTDTTLDGVSDSVGVFQIVLTVNSTPVTGHAWTDEEILLFKTTGMWKMPMWYLFPYEKAMLRRFLHGAPLNEYPLSYNTMFTYAVGDAIHFTRRKEAGTLSFPSGYTEITQDVENKYRCTVSAIALDDNGDKVFTLECEKLRREKIYPAGSHTPNQVIDSISIVPLQWTYSSQSGHLLEGHLKDAAHAKVSDTGIEVYTESTLSGADTNEQCPREEYIFEPWWSYKYSFRSGLGLLSYSKSNINDWAGTYQIRNFNLVYYEGDSMTYGEPLPPLGIKKTASERSLNIYPNPAREVLYILSSEMPEMARIYDIEGRLLAEITSPGSSLNLESFDRGIYLLVLQFEEQALSRVFVKAE